jgi:hypothetical protein
MTLELATLSKLKVKPAGYEPKMVTVGRGMIRGAGGERVIRKARALAGLLVS